MGNLIFLIASLFSFGVAAQEVNLLKNPNFESRTSSWVKTGASTFSIEAGLPLDGTYSGKWDASATGEFFRSSSYTIPAGLKGVTCLIQVRYLWEAGTTGHILMNVDDGTNNVATFTLIPTSGASRTAQINFTCPTTGTLRFELESTANAAEITLDQAFLGTGKNSFQLSQASLYGGVEYGAVGGCEVATTSGTVAEVANDTDCTVRSIVGNAQYVNNQFKMRFSGLPAGQYELTTTVPLYASSSGTVCELYVTSSGGTGMPTKYFQQDFEGSQNAHGTSVNVPWSIPSSISGTVEFFMNWRRIGGAGSCVLGTLNAGGSVFSMSLKRYPLASAEALNLETTGWRVDANISGAQIPLSASDVATYTGVENASLTLVNNVGTGVIPAQIPCSSTNPPTGTTCAAGNESVGVSFNVPAAGAVLACVSFAHAGNGTSAQSNIAGWQIVETAANAQTILQEGNVRLRTRLGDQITAFNEVSTVRLCGNLSFASAGQKTLRLMYEQDITGALGTNEIPANSDAVTGQPDIHWEVYPIGQSMPTPVFTEVRNKVDGGQVGEKIRRVTVSPSCTGSPCTIATQGATWLTNITRSGTGNYAANIVAATFSAAPTCFAQVNSSNNDICTVTSTGTTVVNINCHNTSNGAAVDQLFSIFCFGPQ